MPGKQALCMYKYLPLLFFLFSALHGQAQVFKVQGRITNSKQEPVPYVTVRVKETQTGTISKQDGSYELNLAAGNYHLLVTMIGYKSQQIAIAVDRNIQKEIKLEDESQSLSEVVVKAKIRDRAEEVMRQVIRKKDSIQAAAGAYSSKVYIKAVQKATTDGKQANTLAEADRAGNWQGMSMAEIVLQMDVDEKKRIKEERLAVKKNGNAKGLFYQSATEGSFNFYDNLVKVPAISPTPFVSPVSYSGLVAYKFKTVKVQRFGKHRIYTFSVKPLQVTNATVEGELTVSDSAWVVLHARFRFPRYHLQEYDFFEVEQDFAFVNNQAWVMTRQVFTYKTQGGKRSYSGKTEVAYSEHQLNKQFNRRHFTDEVSVTAAEAYSKDSAYWQTIRTTPLNAAEARYVQYQDSLQRLAQSQEYLDSLDNLINRITWKKLGFFGQSFRNHRKERTWHLSPLISLYQPFAFGGGRINAYASYSKTFASRKNVNLYTNLSYGIRNSDVNGSIELGRLYNPFSRGAYRISAGREFAFIYEGDAWINMIKRNNIYLNNYVGAGHGIEILNGLVLNTDAQLALRRSVNEYKTGNLVDSVLGHVLEDNQAISFKPYNAFYSKVKLQYTPAQRYKREPREKVILGSRFPTFYALWEKGVPRIASSEVDFDYLEFGAEQLINLGLIGVSRYTVKTGKYFNQKDLRLIDHKFQRRGDPLMFMNPHKSFQSLDSSFPVFNRYYEGHLVHEFNGLFLNKIPLFKKLQLREVGGAGFLLAPELNLNYAELFVGVERAFESPFNPLDKFKIGVYVVGAAANQFKNPVQFKVGFTTWDKRRNKWF